MERTKERLRRFRENWSISPDEREIITGLKKGLVLLNSILMKKVEKIQKKEEQIYQMKRRTERRIRMRRLKAVFNFFS